MRRFPDREGEQAISKYSGQSAAMGLASMNSILRFEVCASGLRVGMLRVFGPFFRDFFVPWEALSVRRSPSSFLRGRTALLEFGPGLLKISGHLADQLWRSAAARWPEPGPPPEPETR
jgi:hypothetical protein